MEVILCLRACAHRESDVGQVQNSPIWSSVIYGNLVDFEPLGPPGGCG